MSEAWVAIAFTFLGLFSLLNTIISLKNRSNVERLRLYLRSSEVKKLFEEAGDDAYRRHEVRIKAIETEWEDTYNKFDRIMKRLDGQKGGRPPKEKLPDVIPLENMQPKTISKVDRKAAIMRRARASR